MPISVQRYEHVRSCLFNPNNKKTKKKNYTFGSYRGYVPPRLQVFTLFVGIKQIGYNVLISEL